MAPLVAFPLIILGFALCLAVALWLAANLPHFRCRTRTRLSISAALFLAALPAAIWGSAWASKALVILLAYGHDAYAAGLWIISKHGDLSDGGRLNDVWMGIWGAAMFLSFVVPMTPLVVFLGITGRPAERGAKTGEALFFRGLVRQQHGLHALALEDFQMAAHLFTAFLRYADELPSGERDAERVATMRDYLHRTNEAVDRLRETA